MTTTMKWDVGPSSVRAQVWALRPCRMPAQPRTIGTCLICGNARNCCCSSPPACC
jgi:hypothetical protein